MALVKFVAGTAAKYAALASHDANTLYFLEDTHQLYKGDVVFTQLFETVTADPSVNSAKRGVTYVNTATGRVTYFNGTALQEIVPAKGTAISGAGDNSHLATTKAVVDYVAANSSAGAVDSLAKRVTANEGNITTIQGQITTINGTDDGSIQKAASDAQKAAETTAATNLSTAKAELEGKIDAKATKATTLAGYGITDAYTKTQTDTAINTAVANAGHLKRAIVKTLPAVSEADANTIYMVPDNGDESSAGSTSSSYKEYMLINGAFERIGTSDVDLTNYATKTYAETQASEAKSAAITAAAADATEKINALDVTDTVVSGQYVSGVSQTDGKITVTRASLPAAATLVTGTANGTVAFNGKDVAVKGLGSAAYTETSAYATAAQGSKADSALQKADIATGTTEGTIAVKGADVAVAGLKSAAFTLATDYDKTGEADKALTSANRYTDDALTWGTL